MVQYCIASLICASIPGNKYWNGVLFGSGEFFGMFFSQFLLTYLNDMSAYYIVAIIGQVCYMTFIFFPTVGLHTYMATFATVVGTGGWFNVMLLILELRIPPAKVG